MIVVIKLHQFTFHLDTSNGAVTQFLSKPKGYSVTLHAGHPMISKVYARYAQDEAMAGKQFNGHTYVRSALLSLAGDYLSLRAEADKEFIE